MAAFTNIDSVYVLNQWAIANGHPMPIVDAETNTVTVSGVNDSIVQSIIDGVTATELADARAKSILNGFEMLDPIDNAKSFVEKKRRAIRITHAVANSLREKSTKGASAAKITGWLDKLTIAEKIISNTASAEEINIIQSESDMRQLGETVDILANKIIAKGAALRSVRSKIDGFEDKALRDINAASNVTELDQATSNLIASATPILATL